MDAALPLIENAYAKFPNLQNAYSQVAWKHYIDQDTAYDKVISFFKKDDLNGKLNGEWKLNYAGALLVMGNQEDAERQIYDAYQKMPCLFNGFSNCGFLRHFIYKCEPHLALKWFEKDQYLDRLKHIALISYACMYAAIGDLSRATSMVKRAYAESIQANSGYALIGWYYYGYKQKSLGNALEYFKLDDKLNRLHPNAGYLYAGIYAHLGKRDLAEKTVEKYYGIYPYIVGANLIVGLCDYACKKDAKYLLSMAEKDLASGHLSRLSAFLLYALVLLKCGDIIKAKSIVKKAANRSLLVYDFAESFLNRFYFGEEKELQSLLSGKLKKIFSIYCKYCTRNL
jgi:hypothetical protein